ncbi:MAG: PCMD domain-containing protein [Porphyromonadaceae bacterium]|nr:PCMD domain-containing protein [Porphyromonadaceae bacterium]
MTKRLTLVASLALTLFLSGCYKNDPLKEKERELEGRKNRTEQTEDDKSGEKNPDTPEKTTEGNGDNGGGTSPGNSSDSGTNSGGGNGDGGQNVGEQPTEPKQPEQPKPAELVTTHYDFDLWKQVPKKKYTVPLLTADEDPANSYWVSASNEGFDFATIFGSPITGYPVEATDAGYKGKGVRLRTVDAIALVTGALYTGKVNVKSLTNPTLFGQLCEHEPLELSFYYQYTPGKGKVAGLPDDRDHASVQGVLYEVTTNDAYLDSKTIKDDARIVSRAYMLLAENKGSWKQETVKFTPVSEEAGKEIDFSAKKYRLSIIISSSAKGDEFKGANLSELLLDELTLKSKKTR